MEQKQDASQQREVLEFDLGVRVYPPATATGYWRVRWQERRKWRDTSARSRGDAIAKASELVERLARSAPTDLARAKGADLVAHYLDPARGPPRVRAWSDRHRDEQTRYCNLYVLPVIGDLPCRQLTRDDFQQILSQARTPSVAQHLKRCLTGIVNAGLEQGHLLARQDLLRGVRWHGEVDLDDEPVDRAITEDEIPKVDAVHALAAAAAARSGVWWHELQILLVAYSGMRWGEHTALASDRVRPADRRLTIDRHIVETRNRLKLGLPKGRRRRVTMYPARTPGGVDLGGMIERRLAEVGPEDLLFTAPMGGWLRRSNWGRYVWDRAADDVGWPRSEVGTWRWTFHSLRHVFATWALHDARIPIEDVSRLMGHSSTRVTQASTSTSGPTSTTASSGRRVSATSKRWAVHRGLRVSTSVKRARHRFDADGPGRRATRRSTRLRRPPRGSASRS